MLTSPSLSHRIRRRLRGHEEGFTLVELLVVIVVLAVIVAPLAAAIVIYFQTSQQAEDRMAESHDAQIAAAYFAQDVQSAGRRDWGNVVAGFPPLVSIEVDAPPDGPGVANPCGEAGTPNAVVRFAWDDLTTTPPSTVAVSYVLFGDPAGPRELRRITCDAAGTSQLVLARNVRGATLECVDAAGATVPACDGAQSIRLTLALRGASSSQDYSVTLVGQRRQT